MASDSSRPDFWDTRFRSGTTPWDAGGVPPQLAAWVERRKSPGRVLIPGCGSGYEARLFAERGWDVLAIDFSDAAIEAARQKIKDWPYLFRKADFFELRERPFDLVYERAFLCALPRKLWPDWGRRMAELTRPAGELAGFYYLDDDERGPPFGIGEQALKQLLEEGFALTENQPVPAAQSLPVFKGKESWQVWRRRP